MSSREAEAEQDRAAERTTKMARIGRKYATLFELASVAGTETVSTPPDDWASKLLRQIAAAGWSDPTFLEELSESGLVRAMCRALPVLKANAASRATATSVQDLADLEESMRKLRHELALAEKRLPSHGMLGNGGTAFYTTWASVGHVCSLMLQALTHSSTWNQATALAIVRPSPSPMDAVKATNGPLSPGETADTAAAGIASSTPQATADEGFAAQSPSPASTIAATASGGLPGTSTPRGGAPAKPPAATSVVSPCGGSMPALATESALIKLLGNKHVVAHAKEVMRVFPESYKASLARILLTQISTDMKATQAGLDHILQILRGDPAATSPAPSALPKAWFSTAALLTAYSDVLRFGLGPAARASAADSPASGADVAAHDPTFALAAVPAASPVRPAPPAAEGGGTDQANGDHEPKPSSAGESLQALTGDGDVEMADAPADAPPMTEGRTTAPEPTGLDAGTDGGEAAAGAGAPSMHQGGKASGDRAGAPAVSGGPMAVDSAAAAAAAAPCVAASPDDPRAGLIELLQSVTSALCEAVTGTHGVGRMALLLRGEAAVKFQTAAAYMPAALSINELMGHLDGLACVATALGASDVIRPSVTSLLTSQAIKELLGAGKVYVTTVIAAGALTRDLAIDAVIPQSLRQGYMAAVLTPLETGALLNERRAPQVLAYRSSITESSYYQVMDAESLPYGVNVRFEDEQEAEGMGVVREWLSQIAADVFSPERGLFVRGAADKRVVHPTPASRLQEDFLGYMRFAGRIVGLALRANVPLGVVLSTGLFSYMTGRRATLQDLQQIDPQVYTTCQNILTTQGVEALELFHVWHGSSGAAAGGTGSDEQELVPGGASLRVTDANKAEYVQRLSHHVVVAVVEEQCAAFLMGVQDTAHHLPDDTRLRRAFLAPLLLEDLNRITAGESTLDPGDWAEYTDVAGFESPEDQESLDMFWQLVSEYGQEDRQRLLQFWTAMTHLPSGGFKALNQRLQIMKLGPSAARPVSGEQAGGRPAATAAAAVGGEAAAANGHGPSADGTGPHSHRIDGDGVEVDEPEQDDGMDEGGEIAQPDRTPPPPPPQSQQQGSDSAAELGTSAAGGNGAPLRPGPGVGDAAPAAEADLSGAERATAAAGRATASDATAAGGGGASGQAPHVGAHPDEPGIGGGEADVPYGDDGEDMGAGDDGMDYGDEEEADDEEAEFQRQLEMALALSLRDMSAAAMPGPDGGPGDGTGAGGSQAQAGPGSGGGDSGAGTTGESATQAGEAPLEANEAAAAAPSDSDPPLPTDAALPPPGDAGAEGTDSADAGADTAVGVSGSGSGAEAASGLGGEAGASEVGTAGAPPPDGSSTDAAAPTDTAGGNGEAQDAAGCAAATAAAGGSEAGVQAPSAEGAAAEASAGAGNLTTQDSRGTVAGDAAQGVADMSTPVDASAAADAATTSQLGGAFSVDPMDMDGAQGPVSAEATGVAADAGGGGGNSGASATQDAEAAADAGNADAEPSGQSGLEQEDRQRDQPGQAQEQQPQQEQEQQDAMGEQQASMSQHREEPQEPGPPQEQEQRAMVTTGGADAQGGGSGAAASRGPESATGAPQSSGRTLPLLPQARTCFLQLNLPVYASLEDMRRAFSIALDNMSFGLH